MKRRRLIAGLLLAPLFTVLTNLVMAVPLYLVDRSQPRPPPGTLVYPDPMHPLSYTCDTVLLFSIYGVPTAFLTLVVLWFPSYLLLRRHGWAKPFPLLMLSMALSVPAVFVFRTVRWGPVVTAFMFLHGIAVGLAFIGISGLGFSQPALPESRTEKGM
jgi:hypothetical protein